MHGRSAAYIKSVRMTSIAPPSIDADLPDLLRCLQVQFSAGDDAGWQQTLAAVGAQRVDATSTLVGALCLGGSAFARQLVASQHPALDPAECTERVLDAFFALVDAPEGTPPDHERRVADWLIDGFGLQASPDALLDIIRTEFLITVGPLAELSDAVLAAMRYQQWALSLQGLLRLCHELQDQTPRNTYGLVALCLHKLGRYDEAEKWTQLGLGEQQALLHIPAVRTEQELLSHWGDYAEPVISIICTAYNHERYIESAIRGFLSQDCPYPFEILIHDDASKDGTQAIIRRWQAQYPSLIKPVLQTENQFSKGVRPFELLLLQARGEFVATCEGDDFWIDSTKLRRQVGFLKQHPDVSCSAHNYYHFIETTLTVRPWSRIGRDFFMTPRQLMGVQSLLWFPTLVFRKTFSVMPPERDFAAFGDQFLTSYLGSLGRCAYFETMLGAVRRENEFSMWSPLPKIEKERMRVKTWSALIQMHRRLGNYQAVVDLTEKVNASTLDNEIKLSILEAADRFESSHLVAA